MSESFSEDEIVWGYTTVPERASPHVKPLRLKLLSSFPWDNRTLWNCLDIDSQWGSQWIWDERWLSREPVKRQQQAEEE